MNVNMKKFDRLRQWGKERMGGEVNTTTTDDFKLLETEMDLRHQGMDRLQQSTSAYIKSISKRDQGDTKEKQLPVGYFGGALVSHGDDFEPDSEFGQCLQGLGRANERIARMQETYCANATSSWLESVERSLIQMKEYQAARKKLESRRLAYDTATAKMQKSKKEDYRMEEELRSQKAKYEESSEEVYRRMIDIKEAEVDSVADLTSFLEAELTYYDRCRDVLMQLKNDWPGTAPTANRSEMSSDVNGRSYYAHSRASSNTEQFNRRADDEPEEPPTRPTISSRSASSSTYSPRRERPNFDIPTRPHINRSVSGFEGPTSIGREQSPTALTRLARVPTEPTQLQGARSALRVTKRDSQNGGGIFGDDQSDYSDSPTEFSRTTSMTGQDGSGTAKRPPPPPPPSRSKKPPPPPPMKRSALSTSEIPRY